MPSARPERRPRPSGWSSRDGRGVWQRRRSGDNVSSRYDTISAQEGKEGGRSMGTRLTGSWQSVRDGFS